MKKLILAVFIFCSAFASAQISIPQVTGLPAALASKVDKVTGKSLIADTSIVKLTGVQAGAQVNKIEGIQKNGVDLTITGKKVNITVPTTAAEIGAELANSNIQAHISNTLNPHSVTKTQVGLGNADNTSDANKPISSATQTALNGKQNTITTGNLTSSTNGFSITNGAGAVIGTGTAINISTASASNGGILTQTDWNVFNNKEPAFSKNTAFNKNFGTTTGTVLEGRTFGTAAGSAVGDFIQNQNSSAQSANMWIGGTSKNSSSAGCQSYVLTGLDPTSYQASTYYVTDAGQSNRLYRVGTTNPSLTYTIGVANASYGTNPLSLSYDNLFSLTSTGAATFSSTVNSTGFLLNGNNLTSSLSTNYIPKWNGSSMVNSLISDDGLYDIQFGKNTNPYSALNLKSSGQNSTQRIVSSGNTFIFDNFDGGYSFRTTSSFTSRLLISNSGDVSILSKVASTTPTTGALVVGGGIGVGGGLYTSGKIRVADVTDATNAPSVIDGSISTDGGITAKKGIRAGDDIVSNGSISAYLSISANGNLYANGGQQVFPIYQTQTIVYGSTSGNIACSMPFRTGSYKKVMIRAAALTGTATYTYPVQFLWPPVIISTNTGVSSINSNTTDITLTGTASTAIIILEGY